MVKYDKFIGVTCTCMLPYVLLELQAIVDHHPAHLALVPHGFQGSLRLQLEVKEKGKGILCWECEFLKTNILLEGLLGFRVSSLAPGPESH